MMRRVLPMLAGTAAWLGAPAAQAQDLAAAIADALAHAPQVEGADAGEAGAKARLEGAKAQGNPLLRAEGSAGIGRIDNHGFFGISAANTRPLALQAVGEMPLYSGGRIAAAIDQAKGGAEVARLQAFRTRDETALSAVATYAEVLTARGLEARHGKMVDALNEVARVAALRFRAGEISSSDVAQAHARGAEGVAALAQARGRRISAEAAFRRLTGKDAGELAPLPALPELPATLGEAIALASEANPALLQAGAAVDIARAGTRAARAEGRPELGAFAEAVRVRDQFFPDYEADSVALGIRGRWTLWAGGRTAAQIRGAEAELAASQARAREAALAVEGMVIDAWQGVQTAGDMVRASGLQKSAAEEVLRGTRLEAKVGAKPMLAVLDAEREAIAAEAALIEARGAQIVAAWRLRALVGTIRP